MSSLATKDLGTHAFYVRLEETLRTIYNQNRHILGLIVTRKCKPTKEYLQALQDEFVKRKIDIFNPSKGRRVTLLLILIKNAVWFPFDETIEECDIDLRVLVDKCIDASGFLPHPERLPPGVYEMHADKSNIMSLIVSMARKALNHEHKTMLPQLYNTVLNMLTQGALLKVTEGSLSVQLEEKWGFVTLKKQHVLYTDTVFVVHDKSSPVLTFTFLQFSFRVICTMMNNSTIKVEMFDEDGSVMAFFTVTLTKLARGKRKLNTFLQKARNLTDPESCWKIDRIVQYINPFSGSSTDRDLACLEDKIERFQEDNEPSDTIRQQMMQLVTGFEPGELRLLPLLFGVDYKDQNKVNLVRIQTSRSPLGDFRVTRVPLANILAWFYTRLCADSREQHDLFALAVIYMFLVTYRRSLVIKLARDQVQMNGIVFKTTHQYAFNAFEYWFERRNNLVLLRFEGEGVFAAHDITATIAVLKDQLVFRLSELGSKDTLVWSSPCKGH